MARVSYVEDAAHPELAELIGRIRGARRGNLLKLYRLLLHSPALAESWFQHNNAVRWKTELDGRLRELVILRVCHLNSATYVINQHVPELALAEGLTETECGALADWMPSGSFTARERAALAYADAMTRDVAVPDAVFAALTAHFSERQIVELTVLVGTYNMQTRVLRALAIDPEPHHR
ncbi:MAG: carboxymuconolactone decarboxylase family protein [Xanthobacteraceae bacterium]